MKKPLILVVGILAVIVIATGAFLLMQNSDTTDTSQKDNLRQASTTNTELAENNNADASNLYSSADVAQHNKKDDCWTIINGNVYDITEYINKHPGGEDILLACGTEGSSLFNERASREGDQIGSGTPHSSNAERQLEDYRIGQQR